jgi:trans-aconitate methyltransferase
MKTTWNPGQYLKFRDERTRPSIDLACRISLAAPTRILDVGCGPGNSTEVLHDRWPAARITGLDSSPEMIAQEGPMVWGTFDYHGGRIIASMHAGQLYG